jgi:hypothetical protein
MGRTNSFWTVMFLHEQQGENKEKEELWSWNNNGGKILEHFLELLKTEEASCQACRRTRLSGLKSELLCELHCNNK